MSGIEGEQNGVATADIPKTFHRWRAGLKTEEAKLLKKVDEGRLERDDRQLGVIQVLLSRMSTLRDQFGKCLGCERKIPRARLEAVPEAALCVECQREVDQSSVDKPDTFARWESVEAQQTIADSYRSTRLAQ